MSAVATLCLILPIVVIVAVLVIGAENRKRQLEAAHIDYERSLSRLKVAPADPQLREQTLAKGRVYSKLTREDRSVTVYDEVAILNDISAACAAVATIVPPESSKPSTTPIEERLVKLASLKEQGLITATEYESRRDAVLSEI